MYVGLSFRSLHASCFSLARSDSGRSLIARSTFRHNNNLSRQSDFPATMMASTTKDRDESYNVGQADIGAQNEEKKIVIPKNKSWRELLEISSNLTRNIRGSNYVQLASVDPKTNEPRCRSVVFRGFLEPPKGHPLYIDCSHLPCVFRMITDQRSRKVDQVMGNSNRTAELLWWFPKTSEQYRVRGELIFVGSGRFDYDSDEFLRDARVEQWKNLRDSAQESYFSEPIPGEVFEGDGSQPARSTKKGDQEKGSPPDNFLLMLLLPKHVDYLLLSPMYRQIDELDASGSWRSQRVNP